MIDPQEAENWEEFWSSVEKYAKTHRIRTRYVEEEFILDGELIEVPLISPRRDS